MARPADLLRGIFAGVSPRERRLVFGALVVVGLLALVGVWAWSRSALDEIEAERVSAMDALRTIRAERAHIRQRSEKRTQLANRYRTRAPALTSFVEDAAREAHVTVSEANDRQFAPTPGSRFQKRAVVIRLRQVDLQSLTAFMNRIDSAPFPVAITAIRIRKRFGESNKYDVDDFTITTFDRLDRAAPRRSGSGSSSSSTSSSGTTSGAP